MLFFEKEAQTHRQTAQAAASVRSLPETVVDKCESIDLVQLSSIFPSRSDAVVQVIWWSDCFQSVVTRTALLSLSLSLSLCRSLFLSHPLSLSLFLSTPFSLTLFGSVAVSIFPPLFPIRLCILSPSVLFILLSVLSLFCYDISIYLSISCLSLSLSLLQRPAPI